MNSLRIFLLATILISCCLTGSAQTQPPVLISEATSTRAIALESVTFKREPFSPTQVIPFGTDKRTHIILFAQGLILQPGEGSSAITASAEDATHTLYPLKVEYVGAVPGQQWVKEVVLRLNDDLRDVGDVLVSVAYHGLVSNRVRIGIGHVGGGPQDDPGSAPTPGTPYTIGGQITLGGKGLSGIQIALSGTQNGTTFTDGRGIYFFTFTPGGDYSVTPLAKYYAFAPPDRGFSNLSESQSGIDFTASRLTYTISGQARDGNGVGFDGVNVTLTDNSGSVLRATVTSNGGNYSLADVPAGYSYVVILSNTSVAVFTPQTIIELGGNLNLNFVGTRRTFNISGQVTDGASGIKGATLTLAGGGRLSPQTTTTDNGGFFSFSGVSAGFDYTVMPLQTPLFSFSPPQNVNYLISDRTVNFTGTLRHYRISGKITSDGTTPATNVGVKLQDFHGFFSRSTDVDGQGNYSFTDVPAGGAYIATPIDSVIYGFTGGQIIQNLDSDRTINFIGTKRTYTISGQVVDQSQKGLSGVTVTLAGPFSRSTVTDFLGNYSFNNLPVNETYHLSLSKAEYIFDPPGQDFVQLIYDQKANFLGRHIHLISGRVTDSEGRGLLGISVGLSGPETGLVRTGIDGSYSFTVTTLGGYTVTPSIEQDYYTFAPSSQSLDLSGSATASFTASLSPLHGPTSVLEYDGTPATADYSYFWPEGVDLGHFYWEFWAMPGANNYPRYLLSDGYGGTHALLFGFFSGNDPKRYVLYGNIFNGTSSTTFFSDDGPAPSEWGHFAVGWDGKFIVIYYDGVPVGKQAFAGPRRTLGPDGGGSWLFIGGSDHQNLIGRIAQVRGFEGTNPREGSPESSFAPQTVFDIGGNFLSYYFRPSQVVADLSPSGYQGHTHPGRLRGMLYGYQNECPNCPLPKFVVDQTAPDFTNTQNPGQIKAPVDSPAAIPKGALIFDSFSRPNSTYVLGGKGGLGSTEGGFAGPRVWQTNVDPSSLQPFGILNGRVVLLADATSVAWVQVGSSSLDIRVDHYPGAMGSGMNTGLAFRFVDASNYFFAYTNDDPSDPAKPKQLTIGYYQDGKRTDLVSGVGMPAGWTALRVVTTGEGQISAFADTTSIYSTDNRTMATATGVGLYNNGPGMALTNRWDNFTVFVAP